MLRLAALLAAVVYQCCTCGTCLAIEADDTSTAWAACISTGQNSAWRVAAMKDDSTGVGAAQRFDGCPKMNLTLGAGWDLCSDPCAVPVKVAQSQIYCYNAAGTTCFPWPSPFGIPCDPPSVKSFTPCPSPTPTPAPATPTPTPTPVSVVYTIQPFLHATDLGYTYVQAMTMMNGVLFGNGGVCCPGLDDPQGRECIFAIDYTQTPPKWREFYCSGRDLKEVWEMVGVQVSTSMTYKWIIAGTLARRPAVDALVPRAGSAQITATDGQLWAFGIQSLWEQVPPQPGITLERDGWRQWLQGTIEYGGHRWAYVQYMANDLQEPSPPKFRLARFIWQDAWRTLQWAESTYLPAPGAVSGMGPETAAFSGIVMDKDGSLITTVDEEQAPKLVGLTPNSGLQDGSLKWWPSQYGSGVHVLRSMDEGHSWVDTGILFKPPAGKYIMGCGWEHNGRGVAVQPWHLVCNLTTGKGPDLTPSDWEGGDIRVNGAKVPPSWGARPVFWK